MQFPILKNPMNVYLSSQSLKVGTRAEPESNGASDQDMVSKSADEVEEKHTGKGLTDNV